ncbi:MAG: porin family protein [Vicinamibacterales bacterium]
MRVAGVIAGITLAAMCGAVAPAAAQGLTYGVKGGVTLATLAEEDDGDAVSFDNRLGLVAGGFVTWPLGARLALQPEALFTQKGAKVEEGGGTLTQQLDYLDVPVLIQYRLSGSDARHLSVFGGPAIGFKLRARSRASFGGTSVEEDVSDQVTSTDLSIVGGVGYHRGRLSIEGRYAWGVSDIDKDTADDVTIRTRGISFLAGWRF